MLCEVTKYHISTEQLPFLPRAFDLVKALMEDSLSVLHSVPPLPLEPALILEKILALSLSPALNIVALVDLPITPVELALPVVSTQLPVPLVSVSAAVLHSTPPVALVEVETALIPVPVGKGVSACPELRPKHYLTLVVVSVRVCLLALPVWQTLRPLSVISVAAVSILKMPRALSVQVFDLANIEAVLPEDHASFDYDIVCHLTLENLASWEDEHHFSMQAHVLLASTHKDKPLVFLSPLCVYHPHIFLLARAAVDLFSMLAVLFSLGESSNHGLAGRLQTSHWIDLKVVGIGDQCFDFCKSLGGGWIAAGGLQTHLDCQSIYYRLSSHTLTRQTTYIIRSFLFG